MQQIEKFFSTKSLFRSKEEAEIPTNKEAYGIYLKMAWPCVLESILLCMVNLIDTMMVSDLGTNAIAAVGITSQPRFLLLATIFSLNVGLNAVVARRKGEGKQEAANSILKCGLIAGVIFGLLIAIIGVSFSEPLMKLAGAEEHYLADAVVYFKIIAIGLFFQTINLIINAAQRGSGNTKITMQTNVIANVVNVIFNYLLIYGNFGFPRLELVGAALATSFGCFVACVVAIVKLINRNGYLNIYLAWKQKAKIIVMKPIFQVGSSAFVEQVFLRIGFLLYGIMVARLGTTSYATHLICTTILNISFAFGDGIGVAASALVGQMLGAKKIAHAKMYGKIGQRIAFVVSTVLFVLFIVGRVQLIQLFSEEPDIIQMGSHLLIIMAFTTHIQTAQIVSNGCLRGAGDSRYVAVISLISVAIIRPIITYVLCFSLGLGVYGAWISLFLDQVFRVFFATKRFAGDKWSQIRL